VSTLKLTTLFLSLGFFSCTSTVSAPPSKIEAAAPNLIPPQIVRSERVQSDNRGVKTLTVGDTDSDYVISCDVNQGSCITPVPGKDYYLFTKNWEFLGVKDSVTLESSQSWSGTYNHRENIALVPAEGDRTQMGVYWLNAWEDKKQKQ
jgi:hypothetical protein